jgi:hypothetical protein
MHDEDRQRPLIASQSDSAVSDHAGGHPVTDDAELDADATVRFFQFSIAHILLWTFVSAIVMSIDFYMLQPSGPQAKRANPETSWVLIQASREAILGAILSGFAILLVQRRRGATRELQPGEWLLITGSVGFMGGTLI